MRLIIVVAVVLLNVMLVSACSSTPTSTPNPTPTPRIWPFSDTDGDWTIETRNNSDTGREALIAWIESRDSTHATPSGLVLRCGFERSGEAEAFVSFGEEIGSTDFAEVQHSFDDGEIETEGWGLSTDKTALFSLSPTELIWQVMNSQKLALREEGGRTLIFDVEGLPNALFPHRDKL